MSTRSVVSAFICTVMLGGCAQNGAKESGLPVALKRESVAVGASVQAQGKGAVIDQVMAESGMGEGIARLPEMVAMGFDQQPPPPIGRKEYDAFRKDLIEAFDPETVRAIVVGHLEAHYDPDRFASFLAMLKTPLAKKMKALEMEANTPRAQQEMMQMGNIIMGQATPERLALVRRFDEVAQATEMAVEMQVMMAGVTMRNLNRIVPVAQRMSYEQLEQMLTQMRMQSLYPVRQYTQLSMLYAYRSVSDEELEGYIELHETEIGRWSTRLMREAWRGVSERVAADLAEKMNHSFVENNAL